MAVKTNGAWLKYLCVRHSERKWECRSKQGMHSVSERERERERERNTEINSKRIPESRHCKYRYQKSNNTLFAIIAPLRLEIERHRVANGEQRGRGRQLGQIIGAKHLCECCSSVGFPERRRSVGFGRFGGREMDGVPRER